MGKSHDESFNFGVPVIFIRSISRIFAKVQPANSKESPFGAEAFAAWPGWNWWELISRYLQMAWLIGDSEGSKKLVLINDIYRDIYHVLKIDTLLCTTATFRTLGCAFHDLMGVQVKVVMKIGLMYLTYYGNEPQVGSFSWIFHDFWYFCSSLSKVL